MDGSNWRPSARGESNGMDGGDWRALLYPDARQKIVNKIMETLKKHLPISGSEGLVELQKIAERFEERIHTDATSLSDYLRKISMRMLTMENKSQPACATNSFPSEFDGEDQKPSDPALHGMQSQVRNQGQLLSMPLANQSQSRQQLLPQNLPNTTTQSSASVPPALSSMVGITQNATSNIVGQGSNLQNMSGISQNSVSNSVGQGVQSNIFANSQRQMQGRLQQVVPQQHQQQLMYQQQLQHLQQLMYQQQLQHQLLKQKMQQGNIQSNLLPSHMQQQQQMFQSQRGLPEAPSSSMDSTAQSGHTGVVDLQEEIYQKIKSMKELYFPELNEIYQKINLKFQQDDALIQQLKQTGHVERLRYFKNLLERMINFLQLPKSNIPIGFKDKLPQYEKQIICLLSSYRLKNPGMPQQQGQQQPLQQAGGQSHSMTQQLQSQMPQLQQHDNNVTQMQPMNLQPSMTSMQPAAAAGLQHGSMPFSTHLGVPTTQQSMMNALQLSSNLDYSTSGHAMSGMIGSLQQNTVNATQQANINTLSHSGPSALQPNMNPLQQSSDMLQHQHLKQEQLMQTQQLKQQYWQQQMHQQLMQQQQQQQKPQKSVQLQPHQMLQLHQMSEANELKVRLGTDLKPVMFPQHHPSGQWPTYHHHQQQQQQQLKMGAPFPISSLQFSQAQLRQISQHSSPQIDQQSLLASIPKSATPMQSANSPFIVPPSTPSAPSPLEGDPEKQQSSGISSISNAGNMGHQQTAIGLTQAQSLAIGTPGISASPLLAEFSGPDGNQGSAPMALSGKSSATERPVEHLIKVDGMARYYILYNGRVPEIYALWPACQEQVHQFSGSSFREFPSLDEAIEAWHDFTVDRSSFTVQPPIHQRHLQVVQISSNNSDWNTNQPFVLAKTYLVPQEISTAPFAGLDFMAVHAPELTVGTVSDRRPYSGNVSLMFIVLFGVVLLVSIYMIVCPQLVPYVGSKLF